MQSQKSWCHQLCSSGPILPQTFRKALIDNCISSHSILLHMFYALCTLHSFHQRNCLYLLFTSKKVVFFFFIGLLGNQISSNSTNELPHGHHGHAGHGQHRLAAADSRQFSNSTSSLASKSPSEASSVASAPPLTNKSKWHKLFSAFKKNKGPGGHGANSGNANDAFCLKHSHNCSNSFLRAGISNMKGYKKTNQDRLVNFSYYPYQIW